MERTTRDSILSIILFCLVLQLHQLFAVDYLTFHTDNEPATGKYSKSIDTDQNRNTTANFFSSETAFGDSEDVPFTEVYNDFTGPSKLNLTLEECKAKNEFVQHCLEIVLDYLVYKCGLIVLIPLIITVGI